jgi:hypothetical protein
VHHGNVSCLLPPLSTFFHAHVQDWLDSILLLKVFTHEFRISWYLPSYFSRTLFIISLIPFPPFFTRTCSRLARYQFTASYFKALLTSVYLLLDTSADLCDKVSAQRGFPCDQSYWLPLGSRTRSFFAWSVLPNLYVRNSAALSVDVASPHVYKSIAQ